MSKVTCRLTIFFDNPFWIGVVEKNEGGKLSVSKITFGAEPKEYEVYHFLLTHYYGLHFSPKIDAIVKEKQSNPKRMQREVKKQILNMRIGTKSQQALKLQQEQSKAERKHKISIRKEEKETYLFALKQQKKKEKKKGH